jgi:hypothetical protein
MLVKTLGETLKHDCAEMNKGPDHRSYQEITERMYRFFTFILLSSVLLSVLWCARANSEWDPEARKNLSPEHENLEEFFSRFKEYTRSDSHDGPCPHTHKRAFLEQELLRCSRYSFKSKKPLHEKKGEGKTYLRFDLTVYEYETPKAALNIFQSLFASSDVDMGLTYAWDYVLLQDSGVYWLHAACLYSENNWNTIRTLLEQAVCGKEKTKDLLNRFECRCGLGCKKMTVR